MQAHALCIVDDRQSFQLTFVVVLKAMILIALRHLDEAAIVSAMG